MSDMDVQGNWADPDWQEPVQFPIEHDIEYVGGVRVERAIVWTNFKRRSWWVCAHGESAPTPEEAAANCVQYCP